MRITPLHATLIDYLPPSVSTGSVQAAPQLSHRHSLLTISSLVDGAYVNPLTIGGPSSWGRRRDVAVWVSPLPEAD